MNYVIGTRGSKLALKQSEQVKQRLMQAYPMDSFEIRIIQTSGDQNQVTPLHEMKEQGVFVKEIEQALLTGQIDVAVHSLKDMPAQLPEPLQFTKTLLREDPRDVYVGRHSSIQELPLHARIATGSKRRKVQLLALRPDLEIVDIRGNIDTRLRKMEEQHLDGLLLAAAGLHRLQLQHRIVEYLPNNLMVPSVGQGALGIEVRKTDRALIEKINALCEETQSLEIEIERAFLKELGGGCHEAMGAHAKIEQGKITLWAMYGDEACQRMEVLHWVRELHEKNHIGQEAAQTLKQKLQGSKHG